MQKIPNNKIYQSGSTFRFLFVNNIKTVEHTISLTNEHKTIQLLNTSSIE